MCYHFNDIISSKDLAERAEKWLTVVNSLIGLVDILVEGCASRHGWTGVWINFGRF